MDETFQAEYEAAKRTIDAAIRCPDIAAIALVLVWLSWNRNPHQPLDAHVRYGIVQALSGRDLPGVQESKFRDAFKRVQSGAGMNEVCDPSPGPAKIAEDAEAFRVLLSLLTARQRQMVALCYEDLQNQEIAAEMNISPARVSQMRSEVLAKWELLD